MDTAGPDLLRTLLRVQRLRGRVQATEGHPGNGRPQDCHMRMNRNRDTHIAYRPFAWVGPLLPWGDLIMMRKQLLNLKGLCESSGGGVS